MWTSTTPLSTRLLLLSTLAYALFFRPLVCWTVSSAREIVSFMRLKFVLANCDMPNKWNNTTENITMYFYARYSAAIACQHTIESSEERERDLWAYHSSTLYSHVHIHTRDRERVRDADVCWAAATWVHTKWQNGEKSNRARLVSVLGCYFIIFRQVGKRSRAHKMRNENNYVIEIGNRKREMVGFSNRNIQMLRP